MSVAHEQEFHAPPAPPVPAPKPRPKELLFVAIGLFVVGLILAIGGIAKFLPGAIFPGIMFALWAFVMAGLSFVPLPQVDSKEEPLSAAQKVTGIFFEPTRVFRNLRVHPRWAAAFIIIVAWVYYAALIFLIGGEVGQVYEVRRKRKLQRKVFN